MLATYFPKPMNQVMGSWALAQAKALQRLGATVEVVSFTSWVPRLAAWTPGASAYARCPDVYDWQGLTAWYPRWPVYPVGPPRRMAYRNPQPFLDLGWKAAAKWLDRKVADFKPDIVYAHHTAVNGYIAQRIKRRHGIQYVVTDHDLDEISDCERWPGRRRLFDRVVAESGRMVAVANRMEREIRRLFPVAAVCTVHNGTDPIPLAIQENPRPEQLQDKIVLFSCGAFYERKGFPLLVDAFAAVSSKHPRAVLRIAGDGAERQKVEGRIRFHDLEGRVQLLGQVSHAQVLQEMIWADVFVLLGWDEPFGVVFAEAASAGLPLLCCNDGGFSDLLVDERQGLAVPPRDRGAAVAALNRLLGDRDLRRRLGSEAIRLFKTSLKWDHNAARMVEILGEVATGTSIGASESAHGAGW